MHILIKVMDIHKIECDEMTSCVDIVNEGMNLFFMIILQLAQYDDMM